VVTVTVENACRATTKEGMHPADEVGVCLSGDTAPQDAAVIGGVERSAEVYKDSSSVLLLEPRS
jgi:hypothetical protein